MKSYDHIIDIILALVILILFPLIYFGQKQDAVIQSIVNTETTKVINEVRSRGYITREMYEGFLKELSQTGPIYDVIMEHRKLVYEPEYRFRTSDEVIEEQNGAYLGGNTYTYRPISTEIPIVNDPVNTGSMNTATNESVLAGAVRIPASLSHIHSDACYTGNLGNPVYMWFSATPSAVPNMMDNKYILYCGVCNNQIISYYFRADQYGDYIYDNTSYTIYYNKRPKTPGIFYQAEAKRIENNVLYNALDNEFTKIHDIFQSNLIWSQGTYNDRTQNFTWNNGDVIAYDSGGNKVTIPYVGCTYCERNLVCDKIVTGITPTNPVQNVYLGEALITTATVTYLDGSSEIKACTTTFQTNTVGKNIQVPITYQSGGKTFTANLDVSIFLRSKTCVNGHVYNLRADSSDPGCPYCKNWLRSLTIENPATGRITIYKGKTLQENGVMVLATYLDGHVEHLLNGYVDNLDKNYVGDQNVTISYKGKSVILIVTTKRSLTTCGICGRYYELYPDNRDPGCPYCAASTPVFTGNIMKYYDKHYTNDILKVLYDGSGIYYMSNKDYILFKVKNSKKSFGESLLSAVFRNMSMHSIQTEYGGYVRENGLN